MNARPVVDHTHVAEEINAQTNYAMYSVFRENLDAPAPRDSVSKLLKSLKKVSGLTIRGWYDITGFRADADLLVWMHATDTETLQLAYSMIRDWSCGRLVPVWSNIGVHRPAEFNRSHVPAFLAGDEPKDFVCVYPFVRSREWYLIDKADRSRMLREHGMAARDYGDVLANTLASFALGDYEWLLTFESDELTRIVDLMRELRAVEARLHVIEETPFFTGPRRSAEELLSRVTVRGR
ncbi:hydrogen peroxide-dependent heme synthase [Leucobacter chinensis]|uniref:hydrogen peroxide-dependent heme synthase n=1 Tax=Leucobacter chinensis TaxID=2851010 RepID=UPI001C21E399|nr:hydrogen peroxide-dependent heme synthase [Leucobacter chinensis]